VLWWDGDPEGAIDAFTAADEILQEKPQTDTTVRRRRVDVWAQLAQVHRAVGDLETADERLSEAVRVLSDIASKGASESSSSVPVDDALRETQAALGQVCVQKQDYTRAEEMYLAAFSTADEVADADTNATAPEKKVVAESDLANMD